MLISDISTVMDPTLKTAAVQMYSTSAVYILKLVIHTGVQSLLAVVVRIMEFRILTPFISLS
jgi:hypothetical protein